MSDTYFTKLNRQHGSQQQTRLPSVLAEEYLQIDDRSLADLIRALASYASEIRFFNLKNEPEGTWQSLFSESEVMVIADAAEIDIRTLKQEFDTKLKQSLTDGLNYGLQAIAAVGRWLGASERFAYMESRQAALAVREYSQEMLGDIGGAYLKVAVSEKFENAQELKGALRNILSTDKLKIQYRTQSYRDKEDILRNCFDKVLRVREYTAEHCAKLLPSLLSQGDHNPSVSLLLSFLQTYQYTQQKTNNLPLRLLRFYYLTLLQNAPRGGHAERVFLHCNASPGINRIVPKGTLFDAGKTPDFKSVVYQAETSMLLTGAKLSALGTVFLQRHPRIFPENTTRAVTGVLQHQSFPNPDGGIEPVSLLGNALESRAGREDSDAEFGLYIASKNLELAQGTRNICLQFSLQDRAFHRFIAVVEGDTSLPKSDTFSCLPPPLQARADAILFALSSSLKCEAFFVKELINLLGESESESESESERGDAKQLQKYLPEKSKLTIADMKPRFDGLVAEAPLHTFFDSCLVCLYLLTESVPLMGFLHREITNRRIFFTGYLGHSDIAFMKAKLIWLLDHPAKDTAVATAEQWQLMLRTMYADVALSERGLLHYYLNNAFVVRLSTAEGWFTVQNYRVKRGEGRGSLVVMLSLDSSAPAVQRFGKDSNLSKDALLASLQQPMLYLGINNAATVFPYSFVRSVAVQDCVLRVSVKGYTDLVLRNVYGKVDNSQAFQAFSAQPATNDFLRIGGYEYARKHLTRLQLHIEWKNLPTCYGGFAEYYRAYGDGYENSNYWVVVQMQMAGVLLPQNESKVHLAPLFEFNPTTGKLSKYTAISLPINFSYRPLPAAVNKSDFGKQYSHKTALQTGYVNLKLKSKAKLFGHAEYSTVLSDTIIHNTRKRRKLTLPSPPYTPEISRVLVDYESCEKVQFIGSFSELTDEAFTGNSLAFYKTPLGYERSYTLMDEGAYPLFPEWSKDGNLYIGFDIDEQADALSLYFKLDASTTSGSKSEGSILEWFVYTSYGWLELSTANILSDSTNGLTRSGIVYLRLPAQRCRHPGFFNGNCYWLRVSSSGNLQDFGELLALQFDVIPLVSTNPELTLHSCPQQGLPEGYSSTWQATPALPSVSRLMQCEPAIAQKQRETQHAADARINELLRHRNRAITPWDYERLVLERFAEVQRVKCLPACRVGEIQPVPGHIAIIVCPAYNNLNSDERQAFYINKVLLAEIQRYLQSLSSPHVVIDVCNPVYEKVRVRCKAAFVDPIGVGLNIKRLNNDLFDYLSPGSSSSQKIDLGWKIGAQDVERFIRERDYVRSVTSISLLKIGEISDRKGVYYLSETAHSNPNKAASHLHASYPWSLPLPFSEHDIAILKTPGAPEFAKPVGVSAMQIGSTFVIGERSRNV
ncbi:conserved hypothetical protein [Teredinibacter turnerae T7901]|uniref:Baseplate protein J-like domain-containing protein n=1 Tax=Teredinibacter turnerae (strain ATCC 39867 / T7901) TaxID=377629 RepID=C5BJK4_TERTT|nr:hypothetical protein [Teredinibacter turnerae]ACR12387.1 conserved hypothetical protein [Teredinibacter turnerae T7901]